MKPATLICFLLFLAGGGLFLAQLWFQIWSPALFFKLIVSAATLFVIAVVAAFLVRESKIDKKTGGGLD
ncbi:MAG TPA: hypothetical protein VMV79_08880 [Alphaproteobacteria bacterium]|nr:hypothetical protein [Alphaproteobacteria bacterium]